MSALKLAVLRQIAYSHSVRGFIRDILKALIPGKWIDRVIDSSDAAFDAKLDAAFATLDEFAATKEDYCRKVVNVLCDEIARLCEALREVCEGCGYGDYARCYISHDKFVRLLLRTDTVKLGRLKKALDAHRQSPVDLLREIGAILDDRPFEETAALADAERRRANAEIRAIAEDVKKSIAKIDAVGEQVAVLDAKVTRGKPCGRRRSGKHDAEGPVCLAVWEGDKNNATLRGSLNTRVTYESVFARHKSELSKAGVATVAQFRRAIHAMQNRAHVRAKNALFARQDEARQKSAAHGNTRRGKNGIMSDMKGHAKSALALTLAIAGGLASPLRSDATNHGFMSAPSHMLVESRFKLMAS